MKKITFFLALTLIGLGLSFGSTAHADVQIDRGQARSTSAKKFVVVRNARTTNLPKGWTVVWDSTSNDGVTVMSTTTSHDGLVAGILIDSIPSADVAGNTAATDEGYDNWGRLQVWGKYDEAYWNGALFPGDVAPVAGSRVSASTTAGAAGLYSEVYALLVGENNSTLNTSRDSVGFLLEAGADGDTSIDIFVTRG